MKESNRQMTDKIKFSIGAKLIIIISIIVLISLGSITALVSWLVREDLKIAAETFNFETNRRSAADAQDLLENMRAHSNILFQSINLMGRNSENAGITARYFFEQNPLVAALVYSTTGQTDYVLINNSFFQTRSIDSALAGAYFRENNAILTQAAQGEVFVINATPQFAQSLIVLFFPWQNGSAGLIFSPE
ncbi:MAG: hypothetical protein LBU66_09005, partial [Treponema sp.]|nr:hypothetical protein [Treponema sp.]